MLTIRHERRDAVEHRQLILQTAHQLFNQHGVQPVSMHQIAKTAGVGQATLYRRYAHKGDLCLELLEDYGRQLKNSLLAYLEENRHLPPSVRLCGIIDHWVDAIEEKSGLISGLIIATESKMNCNDERGNFFHSPMYKFFRTIISKLLIEMIGEESPPPADPDLAAHVIICSMSPIGYFHIKQEKGYTVDQIKQQLHRLCKLYTIS